MSKAVYIATIEPNSGKSIVVLGMMRMLLGKVARVGYFRPIIDDPKEGEVDNHINTVISHFELDINFKNAYAYTRSEILQKYNQGKSGEIIDEIIRKYKNLEERFDFILVEGTDFSDEGNIIEFDINVIIAKNLGIPAVIVASGIDKQNDEIVSNLKLAYDTFNSKDVEVLAMVANKVTQGCEKQLESNFEKDFGNNVDRIIIPKINSLINPTIKEIVNELEGNVLFGKEYLNNQAGSFGVGAMQLRNYLTHLKDNSLVITPGDRADIILGVLQANISDNYPKISGIILTGGIIPEPPILKLIEGVSLSFPIISVPSGTFSITNKIGAIKSKIYLDNLQKINTSISIFEKYVNEDQLADKLITFKSEGLTPRMFQYNLLRRALKHKKHIVLPEGSDERILRATSRLLASGVVDITLIGNEKKIKSKATKLDIPIDFDKIQIVFPTESPYYDEYVQTFYELRKHKNVNLDMAKDMMADVSYFGTMMIYKGHADGMVSGAVHTTQHTIRPALQFIKTKPGVKVVSSVFFMCLADRVSVFGDCAINPNPNAEQLAEIAISSSESAAAFGIEPKVAMLSYSSGTSGKGEDVEIVREATAIVKEKHPDLKIEGPIQYDAAVDLEVGQSKLPNSEVAGQASVLIFPDLNTGNNTYKAIQRETGALAIGPMLQGLNKPVNDLSRGCTVDDVYNTVIITAIQAQGL
ncbi:phosphate acetyltransferase [Aquimarina sp. EL_43]|uniref:phosphate acetyltransferase n=1 Tax=unclassified Aquimarina TaxID=2627091 RepID=UPI0018C9802E|nr:MULTISPECIES: phosphate acetyltransferase [unclassified Aquimarina]MBG6132659.1 phosphate acetyltransferase [Aquimarina sp. EL_35]MBG6152790.1 phosphate acetyltransferase [Aquimarina sp. EL_32]MBG6170797.1 phosphate acetyltransferase [Aquimarina sp. EL_43]